MEKLELKHIAPYLPYRVNIQYLGTEIVELVGFNKNTIYHTTGFFVELPCNIKPILRPLSDLTKEIEHNGEKFVPYQRLYLFASNMGIHKGTFEHMLNSVIEENTCITELPYYLVIKLIEWHFDVFGLIEKGLAVDIHTISDNYK